MPTLGRSDTNGFTQPWLASTAICWAEILHPARRTTSPFLISSPFRQILSSVLLLVNRILFSATLLVYSTIITQSAPSGTTAPVIIFAHRLCPIAFFGTNPAGIVSIIVSSFARSARRHANPSIADLLKGGISMSDAIVSASTRFKARSISTRSTPSRRAEPIIISNASSNAIIVLFLKFFIFPYCIQVCKPSRFHLNVLDSAPAEHITYFTSAG